MRFTFVGDCILDVGEDGYLAVVYVQGGKKAAEAWDTFRWGSAEESEEALAFLDERYFLGWWKPLRWNAWIPVEGQFLASIPGGFFALPFFHECTEEYERLRALCEGREEWELSPEEKKEKRNLLRELEKEVFRRRPSYRQALEPGGWKIFK